MPLLLYACAGPQPASSDPLPSRLALPSAEASPFVSATPLASATPQPSAVPSPSVAQVVATPPAPATPSPTAQAAVRATPERPTASPVGGAAVFHYVFPVRGASDVSYGRAHHDYPATDIFCPIGSEFVAVTDGVVDFVSRDDRWDARSDDPALRGGISVAIVGDDGVRYYGSHLSAVAADIEPGVRVRRGQLLGLTGKSGNAASTDPHLHFGISHPTTPEDWAVRRGEIAPYDYLRAWQRGENKTPA